MRRSLYFVFFFLLAAAAPLTAQQLDHVQGRLIVQLDADTAPETLTRAGQALGWNQFRVLHLVSKPLNAYLYYFDHTQTNERQLRRRVQAMPGVLNAQFDHFVALRNAPNDAQYNEQWQFLNIGQSGGTVGADLDMELAWDITTGGVTAAGDTIVLCVIDDGLEPGHEDFGDNIFYNYAEIPDNGIDDDNNGFVDDYAGWNTGSNDDDTDDINSHGTPVAGIMAAQGNNEIGVAGVNWDAKLMIVVGGTGVESEVLEAYSYPLTFRQRYNETNGAEGAFVVVTNSSWGVNFGNPADAPLWCAMYDSLGTAGILSCGATANLNIDIDVDGDLPTGCTSEYLISVTNVNHDDQKVSGAGYGLTSVDLGAFGANAFTAATPNTYDGFGGTSGATPHVAGAIGLLYSAPCPSLIVLAQSDPAAAARQVRDYIFNGVDANTSLDTITTTGGRLNVFNALSALVQQCGGCIPPSSTSITAITDTQAQASWNTNDSLLSVTFEYRPVGGGAYTVVSDAASPLALLSLAPCTDYEYRISGSCNTEDSDYVTGSFRTDGCCENPTSISLDAVTLNSFVVTWNPVLAATGYTFEYRPTGAADWIGNVTTQTNFVVQGLDACTDYEYRLRTNCADETIDFTSVRTLTTKGCGTCTDADYCATTGGDTTDEWIEAIVIDDWSSATGDNNGFLDGTNIAGPQVAPGGEYPLELIPGFSGTAYSERWRIWIDYNQDGEFSSTSELAFDNEIGISEIVSDTLRISTAAIFGTTRMRVGMQFNNPLSPCESGFDYGEMEDYCITIAEPGTLCNVPANLTATDQTTSSVTLDWATNANAVDYTLQYRLTSAADWTEVTTNEGSYLIESLSECDSLIGQVRSNCAGEVQSDFSAVLFFGTECTTNTDEPDFASTLTLFPNPTVDQLELWAEGLSGTTYDLQIIGTDGRHLLAPQRAIAVGGSLTGSFDVAHLTPGVYYLRLQATDGGAARTARFVKLR